MTAASTLKTVRLAHLYLGVFLTPAILFFCLTGALQTFSLHETTRGSSYKPPAWIMVLAQIHKKQTPQLPPPRPAPPAVTTTPSRLPGPDAPTPRLAQAPPPPAASTPANRHHPLPLKIFFLITTIGLAFSSLLGLYMSYKFNRNRTAVNLTLLAGIIIPIVLVYL